MQFFITAFMLMITVTSIAQPTRFIISAQNKSITVSGEDDNNDKLLLLKPVVANAATDYLTVKIVNDQVKKTWRRAFYIYDENKQLITDLKLMNADEYFIRTKEIVSKLQKEKTYTLYAVIIPQDQTKQYMVKIPPVLVCKIKLDNN